MAHDSGEFRPAFDRLFPRAQALALRMLGDPFAAEDVAAEALARTYARWSRLRDLPYLDFWVLRVTSNIAIDAVRRRRPEFMSIGATASPDDAAALRLALAAALRGLPKRQREAVVLRYLSDLPENDVAAALGVSAATVHTHVARGLAALRRTLGPDFPEDTDALTV